MLITSLLAYVLNPQIQIDLDAEAQRQIIVDQEKGQYLGHVTTALLEDGHTMLATYPKGHGRGQIVLKRSSDAGLSWSERLDVPATWSTSKEVPTLFKTIDAEGTKRLILHSGLFPIRQSVSEDDGDTWTELEAIGNYGGIVASSCMIRCKDGSYIAMFHDDGRFIGDEFRPQNKNTFNVFQIRSTDGGLSWSDPQLIATHPKANLCEPGIIRSPDGKQLLVLLRENSRQFNSFYITSDDEGKTWSEPKQTTAELTGDRHTAKYHQDGRLFISYRNTNKKSPWLGDWVAWVGKYSDIIEGNNSQYFIRLKDNKHAWDCAYPGVEILYDQTFVTTTYGHWRKGEQPFILSVRLKLEELDQRFSKMLQGENFLLDKLAVTNQQFLEFVKSNPEWQRDNIPKLFADDFYLQHWSGNLSVADGVSNQPVTNVSWYAAQAYAAWNGQRLPSAFEWDSNKEKLEKSSMQWEWVSDFQSSLPQGNSRTICGGEIDASDPAASFRRSILGHQTTPDLGFRCAIDIPVEGIVRQTKTQQSSASDVPSDSIYNLSHSWTKHDGTQLKLSDFKGEIVITSMMFSSCQAACPRLMRELEKIKNSIPQELSSKIKWLLISFDPDVDTPQVLSKFAASYNLNQQWSLLNGNKDAVRDVATAMGVRYLQLEDGSYSHTNVISLLNRDGQIACQLNELGTTQEAFISLVLEQLRNQ